MKVKDKSIANLLARHGMPPVVAEAFNGMVTAKTDPLTGRIKFSGGDYDLDIPSPVNNTTFDLLPTDSAAKWIADKSPAQITAEVDNSVEFNGRPTIKVTVPAGVSGTVRLGTTGADCPTPYGWDAKNIGLAFKSSNLAAHGNIVTVMVGDATYANFYTTGYDAGNFPQHKAQNGDWLCMKPTVMGTGGGAPVVAPMMRVRVSMTFTAQATDTIIWFGSVGVLPVRKKPTIVLTWDDGYKSWYDFIRPLARHYQIPVSMGISSDLIGTNGFLTWDQIVEMHNDPSGLFDFVNHGRVNNSYNTLGAAAYYADVVKCRDALRYRGINHDGPLHHPWIQSVWGNDMIPLLESGGFLTARASGYTFSDGRDQALPDDKWKWLLNICTDLQTGKSLAQAQADIGTVITDGGVGMIIAHDFAATDAAYVWSYEKTAQLLGWLASQRDSGVIEIKSWSRWYSDRVGRGYQRP